MDADEAAGLARVMSPGLAVPVHFGFRLDDGELVGTSADAERFRAGAAPVPVEVMDAQDPVPGPLTVRPRAAPHPGR